MARKDGFPGCSVILCLYLLLGMGAFAIWKGGWEIASVVKNGAKLPADGLAPAGFGAAAVVAGLVLFVLREKVRILYGLIELTVGMILAVRIAFTDTLAKEPTAAILTFVTSAYVIVRGLDNMTIGIAMHEKEAAAEEAKKKSKSAESQ
jgi:dolichol kinase